jgi:type II secretory ATPase GspE/PulE/Tfp pilus assembly ATPase PilB-like protein
MTGPIRRAFVAEPSEASLAAAANSGSRATLRDSGLLVAATGKTTFEEALRVTYADAYREF